MKTPEIIVTDNCRWYTQRRFEYFGGEIGLFEILELEFREYSNAVGGAKIAIERFSKKYRKLQ